MVNQFLWYNGRMKSRANALTQYILDVLLRLPGCFAFRCNTSGVFDTRLGLYRPAPKRGITDIIAIYRGHFIGIEIKIGSDRLRPEQKSFIDSVQVAGGFVLVVEDTLSFDKQFKTLITHLNAKN